MAIVDYSLLRMAYCLGSCNEQGKRLLPSLGDLSVQYGVPLSTLAHRAAAEGWTRQREEAQDRITRDVFERYESELAATIASIDRRAVLVADRMLRAVEEAMDIASDNQERMAVVAKYSSRLLEILNAAHSAYGTDIRLNGRGQGEDSNEQAA
jgi:hypothetical protein